MPIIALPLQSPVQLLNGRRGQGRDQGRLGRPRRQPQALMAGHHHGLTGEAGITDQPAPWLPSVDRAHTPHARTPSLQQVICSQARPLGQPRALPRRTVNTLQATCSKLTTPTRTPACTWRLQKIFYCETRIQGAAGGGIQPLYSSLGGVEGISLGPQCT